MNDATMVFYSGLPPLICLQIMLQMPSLYQNNFKEIISLLKLLFFFRWFAVHRVWKKRQWSSTVACLFPFVFKSCSRCHYYINFLPTQLFPHLPAHHNYNTPSSSNCFWLHLINLLFHKFLPWSPLVEYLQNLCWFFLFNWPNISLWLAIKISAPKLFANYRSPKPLSDSCPVDYPVNLGCSRFGASFSNRDKNREQHNFACVLVTCDGLTPLPF